MGGTIRQRSCPVTSSIGTYSDITPAPGRRSSDKGLMGCHRMQALWQIKGLNKLAVNLPASPSGDSADGNEPIRAPAPIGNYRRAHWIRVRCGAKSKRKHRRFLFKFGITKAKQARRRSTVSMADGKNSCQPYTYKDKTCRFRYRVRIHIREHPSILFNGYFPRP